MNSFEELCQLASDEEWCWNLVCTTCGHTLFKYSFVELAKGGYPSDPNWVVNASNTSSAYYRDKLGRVPSRLSHAQQNALIAICEKASIRRISESSKFPDWLGYLGLVIHYCGFAGESFEGLSRSWTAQLAEIVPKEAPIRGYLESLSHGQGGRLTLKDLERIEGSMVPAKHGWRFD